MPTLVIVDMQPVFSASTNPDTVIAVTNEILMAKQNNFPIMIVEYERSGRTHSGFDTILRGYRHKARIKKADDDGSQEIVRALLRRKFPQSHLRICGVNTDACVSDTVYGLLLKLHTTRIDVVKRACNTSTPDFSWDDFWKHPNLKLV